MKSKTIFGLAVIIYIILTAIYAYKTFISDKGTFDDCIFFIMSLFGAAVFLWAFKKEK